MASPFESTDSQKDRDKSDLHMTGGQWIGEQICANSNVSRYVYNVYPINSMRINIWYIDINSFNIKMIFEVINVFILPYFQSIQQVVRTTLYFVHMTKMDTASTYLTDVYTP